MLRLIVGSDSMTIASMLSVAPAFEPVNTGVISALTTTVSETAASCRRTGTSVASPRATLMSPMTAFLNPVSVAVS